MTQSILKLESKPRSKPVSGGFRTALLGGTAVMLALAAQAAHAGDVAVGVGVGVGAPVAAVSVGYRGGYRGGHGGYYRGGGWGWGVGLGLGTGILLASPWYYPGVVVTSPPTTVIVEPPPQPAAAPALPSQPTRPDPIIYPRNGQTPQQLEADRQECNRWATAQPGALTDSTIFMRAVDACMDGRGYTTK